MTFKEFYKAIQEEFGGKGLNFDEVWEKFSGYVVENPLGFQCEGKEPEPKVMDYSNRTGVLFKALKELLPIPDSPGLGMNVLDIGCGFPAPGESSQGTALPERIREVDIFVYYCGIDADKYVIKLCKEAYGSFGSWIHGRVSDYISQEKMYMCPDLVIHTGFDRPRYSNAWEAHYPLATGRIPDVVLLESGCRANDYYSEHMDAWKFACFMYEANRYEEVKSDFYTWDGDVTQPSRFYKIYRRM